jgi:uncharacterized protein YeaO (DUF488 family)
MEVYTYQLSRTHKVKDRGIPYMDTSIKSGDWMLAPTWELLAAYKYYGLSEAEYTEQYNQLLESRLIEYPEYFKDLFNIEVLAVGCYCIPGKFCHRHLLVKFLIKHTETINRGEIK